MSALRPGRTPDNLTAGWADSKVAVVRLEEHPVVCLGQSESIMINVTYTKGGHPVRAIALMRFGQFHLLPSEGV